MGKYKNRKPMSLKEFLKEDEPVIIIIEKEPTKELSWYDYLMSWIY